MAGGDRLNLENFNSANTETDATTIKAGTMKETGNSGTAQTEDAAIFII